MENNEMTQQEEIFDEELQGMGIPFEDETVPREIPALERPEQEARKNYNTVNHAGCCEGPGRAMDAAYAPVLNTEASLLKRGLGCLKWVLPCGAISMLLWWFQINGLMLMEAAYPCILASAVIGAAGGAWNAK